MFDQIINIGSLSLDHVYKLDHLALPGETLTAQDLQHFPGGKGLNQSIALARAGAKVKHVGCVGPDGDEILELLSKEGVHIEHIKSGKTPSGHSIIEVDQAGQNSIVIFGGANHQIMPSHIQAALKKSSPNDVVLMQNEINDMPGVIEIVSSYNLPIIFNFAPATKQAKLYPLELIDTLVINEVEGEMLCGTSEPREIIGFLHSQFPKLKVVLTLGEQGAIYADNESTEQVGIYPVTPLDTTAAGDTFIGYYLNALIGGKAIKECLTIASKASAMCITRAGATPSIPCAEELKEWNIAIEI